MKRIKILLITTVIILISIILSNMVYAVNSMTLNIKETRTDGAKYTVTVGKDGTTKDATVFKVLRKNGANYVENDTFALYCLRSGLGFGDIDTVLTGTPISDVLYNEYGDLNQDADKIIKYYQDVIKYNDIDTDNSYNSILWIIDHMYLPENPDMDRAKFLAEAGLENSTLTDDEIEVIQQMALWYFANYDQNKDNDPDYDGYTMSLPSESHLSNLLKKNGQSYQDSIHENDDIDNLYKYFIDNAKKNQAQYGSGNVRTAANAGKPNVQIDKTKTLTITKDAKGQTVIGPINITATDLSNIYGLNIRIKDATGKEIPEKVGSDNGDVPVLYGEDNLPLEKSELINQGETYIIVPALFDSMFDFSEITIETETTYFTTKATFWVSAESEDKDEQPILKVEKEKHVDTDRITTKQITGQFTLQLNKIDDTNNLLTGARFTVIDESNGRTQLGVTDNGNGTFSIGPIAINNEGQTFIFSIEETRVPAGYQGINGVFRIKVTTKLSADGTKYVISNVEFVDSTGNVIADVPGVQRQFQADGESIVLIVKNEKAKEFDLALRKFITKINGVELKGADDRTPNIDTSKLNTIDPVTGQRITTAKYTHSKTPISVQKGDIVTYKIRVYNEGDLDGYATQVADNIPEGLGYLLNHKTNTDNLWHPVNDDTNQTMKLVGQNGLYATEDLVKNLKTTDFYGINALSDVTILKGKAKLNSTALENEKIKAYNPETKATDVAATDEWQQSTNGTDGLYYREIEVVCIVLAENTYDGVLRNIAEIQADKPVDENDVAINVDDRDSHPGDVDLDHYNPPADNSTYQEDDDDYEPLVLQHFDLALRKFITGVNDNEVTTRIPEPTIGEDGDLKYVHDKTPVEVANSDLVTYTIRVYNEGTVLGYATEISDDIPDGLVFIPGHATNTEYGWVMYDANGEETEDPTKAVEIRTRYLENTLLNPYDSTKPISNVEPFNPDYADVKVVFQVVEANITSEDRIITNKAQITDDKAVDKDGNELDIEDDDSEPDKWNEGEDDQDTEKVYVKKFDLSLLKWVTRTIVTVDGQTTTTETGFTPYDDPEPIAQVVIDKKKINQTTVKFAFNIMITNQGEIEGYATEITDYIPEGLEFIAEDNPLWTQIDENRITTRALEGTLLKPGETAVVEVIFTWKKDPDNFGVKTNIAEISEDYNDHGSPDIDSDPDNVRPDGYDKQQEDDDDKAQVVLTVKTGANTTTYTWLVLIVLTIISGGIILIKKYVLV